MIVMVIDTAKTNSSVAIIDDDGKICIKCDNSNNSHSESLFRLIESLFSNHNYTYDNIDCIVTVVGPGSFTGIRAGLSAAQGIRLVTKKPLYGVNTLEVQAYAMLSTYTGQRNIRAIIDTSNECVYTQLFNYELIPISEPEIVDKSSLDLSDCITCKNVQVDASHAGLLIHYRLKKKHQINEAKALYLRTM